ncbi:MAG: carbohydrate-binding family 9-like protein [Capsulimonadales bacterium]|nr:carbohydrate-binding family 9-like protein [Capsulimonadales bacterium]
MKDKNFPNDPVGSETTPRRYVCYRLNEPLTIDGDLEKPVWQDVPWTEPFLDIEGPEKPRPRFRTRAKMAWDETCFYVAAYLEEPHLVATLTNHDDIIFHDNDFEIFIDPDDDAEQYYEIEVNAFGTIFDLLLEKTYRNGGPARHEWFLPGMRHAVRLYGTVNDPSDFDQGWSVEFALPWESLAERAGKMACPPMDGDTWRVNFSRVQWRYTVRDGQYVKEPGPEDNWVWSPQGVIDMHQPQFWGYVEFRRS